MSLLSTAEQARLWLPAKPKKVENDEVTDVEPEKKKSFVSRAIARGDIYT